MVQGFLRRLLLSTGHDDLPPEDARLAIASVLVMAARADDHYDAAEQAMIDRALMKRFKLDAAQARGLREDGEAAESEAIDLFQFSRAIKAAIPHDERVAILEELWGVILADGRLSDHETHLVRKMASLMQLEPAYLAEARRAAVGGRP